MKFKHLLYGKDEEVFMVYIESSIQRMSKKLIGRDLEPRELIVLRRKMLTEVESLIIKIDSSGIEQIKPKNREIELQNNPSDEGTFLVKWGFKDKDGNIVFKYYSYPADITEGEVGQIIGKRGKVFKRIK